MFESPLDRVIVYPLEDRGIICTRVSKRNSPQYDCLILFHEDQSLPIDDPSLWCQQSIMASSETPLTAGDEVIILKRPWNLHTKAFLGRGQHVCRNGRPFGEWISECPKKVAIIFLERRHSTYAPFAISRNTSHTTAAPSSTWAAVMLSAGKRRITV